MKVAIMQPYFFPYIGYFQLINAVDVFVIYDDIEYVKQSWINRNRILVNREPAYISLPIKKDSDYLPVKERILAESWNKERSKLMQRIKGAYGKAPFFREIFPVLEAGLKIESKNLFDFLHENLVLILNLLGIETKVVVSSDIGDFSKVKSVEKVLAICKSLNASEYLNPIGGVDLYDKSYFNDRGITLGFLKSKPIEYRQFNNEFQPWLSIIDVLMFNPLTEVERLLSEHETQ